MTQTSARLPKGIQFNATRMFLSSYLPKNMIYLNAIAYLILEISYTPSGPKYKTQLTFYGDVKVTQYVIKL